MLSGPPMSRPHSPVWPSTAEAASVGGADCGLWPFALSEEDCQLKKLGIQNSVKRSIEWGKGWTVLVDDAT